MLRQSAVQSEGQRVQMSVAEAKERETNEMAQQQLARAVLEMGEAEEKMVEDEEAEAQRPPRPGTGPTPTSVPVTAAALRVDQLPAAAGIRQRLSTGGGGVPSSKIPLMDPASFQSDWTQVKVGLPWPVQRDWHPARRFAETAAFVADMPDLVVH